MKLRSKITLGTIVFLLSALMICCSMIISVSKKSMIESSASYTRKELEKLCDNLNNNKSDIESAGTKLTTESMLKYYFFRQTQFSDTDTEYVLQCDEDVIYNNSGLNTASVLNLGSDIYGEPKIEVLQQTDCDYVIAGKNISIGERTYQIYVVRNITELFQQIRQLIAVFLLIGLVVSFIAGGCIVLFLRHSFQPLEQLKNEADAISKGEYERHIEVSGKDELASLSCSFNTMAKAVKQHIAQIEETSETRNRLLHALSHEMRTPVTAICGYSYALQSMKMNDEQRAEALEFIDLEARRLESLSGKLTNLVGLDSAAILFREIDLMELKKYLAMIFSGRKEIELQMEEGKLIGDQDMLLMLITNLCDNARKAQATKIEVKISPKGIWVKDNGKGISKEEQKHIFEAFYQGDASRNQEGFGLGLALCQKIARLHHTELLVESEIGKGSCFYLYNSFTTL